MASKLHHFRHRGRRGWQVLQDHHGRRVRRFRPDNRNFRERDWACSFGRCLDAECLRRLSGDHCCGHRHWTLLPGYSERCDKRNLLGRMVDTVLSASASDTRQHQSIRDRTELGDAVYKRRSYVGGVRFQRYRRRTGGRESWSGVVN